MTFFSVLLLAGVMALAPTLVYALFLWWLDRYEKEPLPLLAVAFVWGAVPAIALALAIEIGSDFPLRALILTADAQKLTEVGLIAPIAEEAVKAIILVALFLFSWREFDDVLDGVIYGAMVGLGFAFVENVIYLTGSAYEGTGRAGHPDVNNLVQLWVLRAGLFGLNHSMFTAFTGAALGLARSLKKPWQRGLVPSLGLGMAMILHSLHNALTSVVAVYARDDRNSGLILGACLGLLVSDWGGLLLILVVAIISSVREAQVIRQTLWEEVALGRFTPDEYATLISGRTRWRARWAVLFSAGFRRWTQLGKFFDLATELAFRKHRMNDGSAARRAMCADDIARLRGEIDHLKLDMVGAQAQG